MFLQGIYFAIGILLVIKGGDLFVQASIKLAEAFKIPRVVIGSTLMSLATTSPELVVSTLSGLKGEPGLAVGNAVGSCICNLGLILGVLASLQTITLDPHALRPVMRAFLAGGILLLFLTLDLTLERWAGWLLVALGVAWFTFDFKRRKRPATRAEDTKLLEMESEILQEPTPPRTGPSRAMGEFLVGSAIVIFGSRLLVNSGILIAGELGVPPLVVGLTILSLGTSLPELTTMVASVKHKATDLAVGNILGANMANITFVVGTAAGFHPVYIERWSQALNFPALLVLTITLYYMMWSGRKIERREGLALVTFYLIYVVTVAGLSMVRP